MLILKNHITNFIKYFSLLSLEKELIQITCPHAFLYFPFIYIYNTEANLEVEYLSWPLGINN